MGTRDQAAQAAVLQELSAALGEGGHGHGPLVLSRPPVRHARSTIYFVGDAARPSLGPRWVVKRPDHAAAQEDLASPLTAVHQFAVLKAVADHFDRASPELRAAQPVGFLSGVEALAMEFVPGLPLDRLVRPRALVAAHPLLDGVALSGAFLRHLHTIRPVQVGQVDLGAMARDVLLLSDKMRSSAGLAIPAELDGALREIPDGAVGAAIVQLHGDFAAVNMILGDGPSITGIDVSLDETGPAEMDLARFVMMLSTQRLFLAGGEVGRVSRLRRAVTAALFESYDGDRATTVLFELQLVRQLCLRWLQRHSTRLVNHPRLGALRRAPVDRHFRALLRERAAELRRVHGGSAARAVLGDPAGRDRQSRALPGAHG